MKNWLIALIVVTLFLSFVGFSNSFVLNSEIGKIQDTLIVVDRLNKDVLTDIALARMEFSRYMTNSGMSSDTGIERLKDAGAKAKKILEMTQSEPAKEKVKNILELINKNIEISKGFKKSGRDETKYIKMINIKISLEKEAFSEMSDLAVIIQKDIDDKIANIKIVSSKFVLLSLFLLVFVTGGIVITTIVYSFATKDQNAELNYYISRNLVDRETGFFNKMYFLARLKELLNKASRFKEGVAVVMINIEPEVAESKLKIALLCAAGEIIKKGTRVYDIVARYDNVIAVLLYKTGQKEVLTVLNRIKSQVEKNDLVVGYKKRKLFFQQESASEKVKIIVSFNVLSYPEDKEKIEILLKG
ncbi:MAG: hypothetical protein A2452_11690 [Candidatus Firestonebacteria bacterium RIFOXYC2_FULL_39_67]|nr:MAG: hypothetical protein A2536_07620 [Candidatus Firestonebacteria bacterium RIFOXYD2_FULL_39_29]OGF53884.1 MAG: hypothetical protein A2452_11690 [Candidatus Firestonebacteria bacterium RIFOXYC2_FULL_39_67]